MIKKLIRPEQLREFSLFLLIVLIVLFFGSQIANYFNWRTFTRISTGVSIIAVVAVGQTLVALTRNIDLSVGSIVGFTAYMVGTILTKNDAIPPLIAILMAMTMGALAGVINGVLVAYGRVPAIITTLGTLAIFRAILVYSANAKTVVIDTMPQWVKDFPRQSLIKLGEFDLRLSVGIALVAVIVFQLMLVYLRFGRRLYAIGSNPEGARMAGLPAQRIVLVAYVLCGALAGLAGFMFLAQFGNITVVAAQGMELQSVAAAVVGGVSTNGGIGSMLGALLGATIIGTLEQSLIRWLQISEFWRDALLGLLILVAVAADATIMNRLRKTWSQSGLKNSSEGL